MNKPSTGGFTIIELLVATSVFSVVLITALAGFIRSGQLFYKGVSITSTYSTAKNVLDDVSGSITNTGADKIMVNQAGNGYSYDCIGNIRYTYNNNPQVMIDKSASPNLGANGNYGILRNVVNGCSAPDVSSLGSATEMLNNHMRVSNFSVTPATIGRLYNINIVAAYGDNDSLDTTTDAHLPVCVGGTQNQQFCAVSNLSTSVFAEF